MIDLVNTEQNAPGAGHRIVVMGVSGSGKSSVGEAIGAALGIAYIDGDRYHPPTNIDKMSRGEPLDDDDRAGWLTELAGLIRAWHDRGQSILLGCSALKRRYRELLRAGDPNLIFLFLEGKYETIAERMRQRQHFFAAPMLISQFEALEAPEADEAICINTDGGLAEVVQHGIAALRARFEQDRQP